MRVHIFWTRRWQWDFWPRGHRPIRSGVGYVGGPTTWSYQAGALLGRVGIALQWGFSEDPPR